MAGGAGVGREGDTDVSTAHVEDCCRAQEGCCQAQEV